MTDRGTKGAADSVRSSASLGLYIHIPFCVKKCGYCDFLSAPAGEAQREQYLEALCGQLRAEAMEFADYEADTVFLGGGTPSLLSGEAVRRLFEQVRRYYRLTEDAEITMEANPGTVGGKKLGEYRRAGVNRLSLGLQSACDGELTRLGRIHSLMDFELSMAAAREAGFRNINVDLMFGIPGQTASSWRHTLERTLSWEPEHISAYSLILEEGTDFYDRRENLDLPDEDTEREMYHSAVQLLKSAGYTHYEISNFALPGKECRHNTRYWERGDYAGFGLGAASLKGNVRSSVTDRLAAYLEDSCQKKETRTLTGEDEMEEFMFLGLRMLRGVSGRRFAKTFGVSMEEVYGRVIKKYEGLGLLEEREGYYRLTGRGIDVSNVIMSEFLF